eukprot:46095_1
MGNTHSKSKLKETVMSPKQYKRSSIIDEDKESKLISTVIKIAFERNSEGWRMVDNENKLIQTKEHPVTKRPIYRSIAKNKSNVTLKQVHQFYEAGHYDDMTHYYIDDNHDIYYRTEDNSLLSDRDFEYMYVRFHIPNHIDSDHDGTQYNIVGYLLYDIPNTHPLYIDPPKNVIRSKLKCRASIHWSELGYHINALFQLRTRPSNQFIFTRVEFTERMGGWVPNWLENMLNYADEEISKFHEICQVIPEILQQRVATKSVKAKSKLLILEDDTDEEFLSSIFMM